MQRRSARPATDGIRHFACTRPTSVRSRDPRAHRTATSLALVLVVCTSCRRESPRLDTTSAPPAAGATTPPAAGATAPNVAGMTTAPSAPATRPYRLSPQGLERIRQREAFVAKVYDDGIGNQTIGYGHMLGHGESFPGGLTVAQAQ